MNKAIEKEQLNILVLEAEKLTKLPGAHLTLEEALRFLMGSQETQGPFGLAF